MKRNIILYGIFFMISIFSANLQATTDSEICSNGKRTLQTLGIKVIEVQIADGRAKGGERSLIVTFTTNNNSKEHGPELVKIFELCYVLNNRMSANLDSVVAVAGNASGKARAIITVKRKDIEWFMTTKNVKGYLKRWTVSLLDRTYLPILSSNMGW